MLPEHKGFIGGSDLANLMGCGFGTKMEVYQRIISGIDSADNDFMALGRLVEPWARGIFERDFLVQVEQRRPRIIDNRYRVSTDGMVLAWGAPRVWECKWTGPHNRRLWGPEGSSQVPEGYKLQANWYMGWEGAELAHITVMFGAPPLAHFLVNFDRALFDACKAAADAFWDEHLLPLKPPPFEPGDVEAVRDLDLDEGGAPSAVEVVEASEDLWVAGLQLDAARAAKAKAAEEEEVLKALVFSLMPENAKIVGPDGVSSRVVRRNRPTTQVAWEKVAQGLKHLDPAGFDKLVEKYTTTINGNRIISGCKEG